MQTYPDGPFLQEEAMEIAKQLEKEELTDFTALNGCLEKWIQICDVREKRLCGETDEVSTTTVQSWTERLSELCKDYESQNKLNLDELGLFLKALPEKGLMGKGKKTKGGRKSKQRMTFTFIVNDFYVQC